MQSGPLIAKSSRHLLREAPIQACLCSGLHAQSVPYTPPSEPRSRYRHHLGHPASGACHGDSGLMGTAAED